MQDIGSQAISSLPSPGSIDEPVEASRIDDLILEQLNTLRLENIALKREIKTLQDNQVIILSLIKDLKAGKDLQPKQQDRREILLALLAANGGKMFAKDARQKMGLGKATFSVLLKSLKDEIDKKPYHLNKSQLVISLAKL